MTVPHCVIGVTKQPIRVIRNELRRAAPRLSAGNLESDLAIAARGLPARAAFGTALSGRRAAPGRGRRASRHGPPGHARAGSSPSGAATSSATAIGRRSRRRGRGYEVVERIAGGRAAAYNGAALNLSQLSSRPNPAGVDPGPLRRDGGAGPRGLASLGVDARVGEVRGRVLPGGAFSVNAGGRLKLAGIGQRMIKGGAHVGCVSSPPAARHCGALGAGLRGARDRVGPGTAGSVADDVPGSAPLTSRQAMVWRLEQRFRLREARPDEARWGRPATQAPPPPGQAANSTAAMSWPCRAHPGG